MKYSFKIAEIIHHEVLIDSEDDHPDWAVSRKLKAGIPFESLGEVLSSERDSAWIVESRKATRPDFQ